MPDWAPLARKFPGMISSTSWLCTSPAIVDSLNKPMMQASGAASLRQAAFLPAATCVGPRRIRPQALPANVRSRPSPVLAGPKSPKQVATTELTEDVAASSTLKQLAALSSLSAAALCQAGAADAAEKFQLADGFPNPLNGASPGELLLISAPLVIYGFFSVYRAQFNPRAKISDFLFLVAGAVVIGNILSIVVFHVRLF